MTGGRNSKKFTSNGSMKDVLSSTEIYVGSVWTYAAPLPSKRSHMSAATLDNSVFVFGEFLCFKANKSV